MSAAASTLTTDTYVTERANLTERHQALWKNMPKKTREEQRQSWRQQYEADLKALDATYDAAGIDVVQRHLAQLKDSLTSPLNPRNKKCFSKTLDFVKGVDPLIMDECRAEAKRDASEPRIKQCDLPATYEAYVKARAELAEWYLRANEIAQNNFKHAKSRIGNPPPIIKQRNLARLQGMLQQEKVQLKIDYEAKRNNIYSEYPEHALIDRYHKQINAPVCPVHKSYHCVRSGQNQGSYVTQCTFIRWTNRLNIVNDEERTCDMAKENGRITNESAYLYKESGDMSGCNVNDYSYPKWKKLFSEELQKSDGTTPHTSLHNLNRYFAQKLKGCPGKVDPRVLKYAKYYVQRVLYLRAVHDPNQQNFTNAQREERYNKITAEDDGIVRACVYLTCEQLGIMGWGAQGDTSLIFKNRKNRFIPPMWGLLDLEKQCVHGLYESVSTNMENVLQQLLKPHLRTIYSGWNDVQMWHIMAGEAPSKLKLNSPTARLKSLYDAYMGVGMMPRTASLDVMWADEHWSEFASRTNRRAENIDDVRLYMKAARSKGVQMTTLAQRAIHQRFIEPATHLIDQGGADVIQQLQQDLANFEFTPAEQRQLAEFWSDYRTDAQREEDERTKRMEQRQANRWLKKKIANGADIAELHETIFQYDSYRQCAIRTEWENRHRRRHQPTFDESVLGSRKRDDEEYGFDESKRQRLEEQARLREQQRREQEARHREQVERTMECLCQNDDY